MFIESAKKRSGIVILKIVRELMPVTMLSVPT
jgi:hypothetical protein